MDFVGNNYYHINCALFWYYLILTNAVNIKWHFTCKYCFSQADRVALWVFVASFLYTSVFKLLIIKSSETFFFHLHNHLQPTLLPFGFAKNAQFRNVNVKEVCDWFIIIHRPIRTFDLKRTSWGFTPSIVGYLTAMML